MEITELMPRQGKDVLRTLNDGLVIVNDFTGVPAGKMISMDYGIFLYCIAGTARFEYDGQEIQMYPNDLFLFFARSILDKFMCSPDFNCREVWFSRGQMWDMNMHGKNSLSDLISLKQHPKVTLSEADSAKLETYLDLLCQNMQESSNPDKQAIIHSLFCTFLLEILSIMRSPFNRAEDGHNGSNKLHGKLLAEKFVELVEQSDGRIRRVEEFAQMLNVTPKYLSRLLTTTLQKKPTDIIYLFTLKSIENRLRYTDLTMQQIAEELGFSSASSFGKFVREHAGMTPLELRKKYQDSL